MAEKSNKNVRFDPERYLDRANYILKQIKDAIENSHTKYEIEPSADKNDNAFKSITGTMTDGKDFQVVHIKPKNQGDKEELYVRYNNVEFYADWHAVFKINIVGLIDNFINNEYVYDMNSNTYVELPKEMTFADRIDNWLTSRKARRQQQQKTK